MSWILPCESIISSSSLSESVLDWLVQRLHNPFRKKGTFVIIAKLLLFWFFSEVLNFSPIVANNMVRHQDCYWLFVSSEINLDEILFCFAFAGVVINFECFRVIGWWPFTNIQLVTGTIVFVMRQKKLLRSFVINMPIIICGPIYWMIETFIEVAMCCMWNIQSFGTFFQQGWVRWQCVLNRCNLTRAFCNNLNFLGGYWPIINGCIITRALGGTQKVMEAEKV